MKNRGKIEYKPRGLDTHRDERGWLVEMLKRNEIEQDIKQVYVATIEPGHTRGGHYHLKRVEWFFVASGKAEVWLCDIEQKKEMSLELSSEKPEVLTIFPKIAHQLKNCGQDTLLFVSAQNDIYNPGKPDTYPYPITNGN